MYKTFCGQDVPLRSGRRRILSMLLWVALTAGWLVAIFSLIEEMCLATACKDTASFTIFGLNMVWFGIAYFSLILILLGMRGKISFLARVLSVLVFAGIGAELRLLWIQKYIIGSWCPICVTICCCLFIAAILIVIDKIQESNSMPDPGKNFLGWMAVMVTAIAVGLTIAIVGVTALF